MRREDLKGLQSVHPFLLGDDLKVTLDALALMGGRSLVGKGELTP